jgi:hypothetical protein
MVRHRGRSLILALNNSARKAELNGATRQSTRGRTRTRPGTLTPSDLVLHTGSASPRGGTLTGLRYSTAIAATIAATLLLTACAGAETTTPGASATASPPPAAKASSVAEKTILTPKLPGRAELTLITNRLQTRGWKIDSTPEVEFTALSSGKWDIMLGAGPVPKEIAAQAGDNKGVFGISVTGVCKKLS